MVPLICVTLFLLATSVYAYNPLIAVGDAIVRATRVQVAPSIRVLDRDRDRLFVVEPERSIIYNTAGALYYYFEGGASGRLCPHNEYALARLNPEDIRLVNETGTFNISCTRTSSLALQSHFENESLRATVPVPDIRFTIVDVINHLITEGYAHLYSTGF